MNRLTKRVDGIAVLESWAVDKDPVSVVQRLCSALAAYEDTGLEPEEIADAVIAAKMMAKSKIVSCFGVDADHIRELVQAEQDGRLVELPFVAMVEQSLQDGKMKPLGDQKHNGRYAVVYVDRNKWKSPLIDICGKPYDREEAEARMAVLAQEGGTHEDSGGL